MVNSFSLRAGLSSRNPFVRKAAESLLRVPKLFRSFGVRAEDFEQRPPVLINSIPKSGTHLLMQVVEGLPDRVNYGDFVATMTRSFQFRERSAEEIRRLIRRIVPGEIVRGHLFFDEQYLGELAGRNVANFFIYRDPRDIALSSCHYLRGMNPWHKLHKYFRHTKSVGEALELVIRGLEPPVPGVEFPDIGQRLARYQGWLSDANCFAVQYEELQSESRPAVLRNMAAFYAARSTRPVDVEACTQNMLAAIAPELSHTFRSGKKAGWRREFTRRHRELFHEVAGQLLIDWGYESDASWVDAPEAAMQS
ncbi:MAG: sulfotransferase domain-containing protein [Pirellulales bacterium]